MNLVPFLEQIERCAPEIGIYRRNSITPILNGWDSIVIDVDGEYIFRFPRSAVVREWHRKESLLLPELAPTLPVSIPSFEYIWLDDPDPTRCFVGYRKIHGVCLTDDLMNYSGIVGQLADFLRALHRFPTEAATRLQVPSPTANDWREEHLSFYAWIKGQVFPLLTLAQIERACEIWEPYLADPANFQFQPVLIHHDLGPEHILCDPHQARITGIIDWGDVTLGDPALDFAGLSYLDNPQALGQVIRQYAGADEQLIEKRARWYLKIGPFHQVRYGIEMGNSSSLEEGINQI
jgi:aminoglycoside 2''-phosphotransferase